MLVEAMACEVVVVGSDSGEIPHVIGPAGLTFPEDNLQSLHEILFQLLKDETLRRELRQAGRERVLAHYTQNMIAARTVDVYREMMSE